METGLLLAFFLALVAGGCSVMCAGMGTVTDMGMLLLLQGLAPFLLQERQMWTYPPLFSGISFFFFFAGDFNPIVRFLRLGLVWLLFRCSVADGGCGNCCCCGFCGDCGSCSSWSFWWILLGAKLRYMPQLLTAPTARASAFHNHHYLPLSADNGFRNCLKTVKVTYLGIRSAHERVWLVE